MPLERLFSRGEKFFGFVGCVRVCWLCLFFLCLLVLYVFACSLCVCSLCVFVESKQKMLRGFFCEDKQKTFFSKPKKAKEGKGAQRSSFLCVLVTQKSEKNGKQLFENAFLSNEIRIILFKKRKEFFPIMDALFFLTR